MQAGPKHPTLEEKIAAELRGEGKVTREDLRRDTAINQKREAAALEWLATMAPGHKLNYLIHVKVIRGELYGRSVATDMLGHQPVPKYSEDIVAAWAVVEHMTKYEIRSVLNLVSPQDDSKSWHCFFSKKHAVDFDFGTWISGESGPHAICLAALDACGVDPRSLSPTA